MKRVNTKAEHFIKEVNGVKVNFWKKVCPICGKEYETSSRTQKFCSDVCSAKAQKRKRKQQREYSATKEIARLSARSHAVAVETMEQLARLGLVERKCVCCGSTDNLQVHHKNLRWLDNTPENLQWVCPKCHAAIHSDIEKNKKVNFCEIPLEEDELYKIILK